MAQQKILKGDCEVCSQTDVELTLRHGDILMCPTCLAEDLAVTKHAEQVVIDARAHDATIELKEDLFKVGAVAFRDIQAAIQANGDIPESQKNYKLMVEVAARIDSLTAVIFADEAALLAKKNERHALLVNAQNVSAMLHEKEREKFKQYDVNYKPVSPKSIKPKAVKAPSKKFNKAELYGACKKYNVPAPQVQAMVTASNLSYEDAAKKLAGQLGLL